MRNRYRTLSLDEFEKRGGRARAAREVLLTFDDARQSAVRVALPLLREFNVRAVLFVPTYWMSERDDPDAAKDSPFMSWDEVRECHESGVFAVESHAHRHAVVHTSGRLAGFADPETLSHYDIFDWPMRNAGNDAEIGFPPLGTPIYEAAPLLSARRCYAESSVVSRGCQGLVDRCGGEVFFTRPDARVALLVAHARLLRYSQGRFLDRAELETLIAAELELSRQAFLRHLGFAPRYLAFPWMLGSAAALERARAAGIVAAFGCALDFRRARRAALPMRVFGRFKADWLRLLPGEQRDSLPGLLAQKIRTFSSQHNLAH
jgi:peptidoglycan/xylan/chitin deacetylase (PgdA/CDA1 family)